MKTATLSPGAPSGRVSLADALRHAVALHQEGRVDDAVQLYRRVLDTASDHPEAVHYLGIALYQRGESAAGLDGVRRSVALAPDRADFQANLGKVLHDDGRADEAEQAYRAALALDPLDPDTHLKLVPLLVEQERTTEALRSLAVIEKKDPSRDLDQMKGDIYRAAGRYEEAATHYERFIRTSGEHSRTYSYWAFCLEKLGRIGEALTLYQRAYLTAGESPADRERLLKQLQENPDELIGRFLARMDEAPGDWQQYAVMGRTLGRLGRMDDALRIFEKIVAQNADDAVAWNDVGTCLNALDKTELAIDYFLTAIRLDPEKYAAYNNLANGLMTRQDYVHAAVMYKEALKRAPRAIGPHINLIRALRHLNKLDEANFYARATLTLDEPDLAYRCNPFQIFQATCDFEGLRSLGDLFDLASMFQPGGKTAVFLDLLVHTATDADLERMYALHRNWAGHVEALAAASPLPPAAPRRHRKTRIGILSSDLKGHSVARFVGPIFRHYDKSAFELYAYTPIKASGDAVQQSLVAAADKFTFLDNRGEREIAETIRADEIDVLMELNGFTMATKLATLAYKPAPVQVCWLGYPYTSGLTATDYLVLDPHVKPERADLLTEKPLLMPESWVCFDRFEDVAIADTLPLERNGVVTFGSLNNPYKYTPETIALWARAMRRVAGSRFLIVRPEAGSLVLRKNIVDAFGENGINADRLYFVDNRGQKFSHLEYYNEIDISLDSMPLTGGTTTCEAVWMGVPVVTLRGGAMHQRMSHSILTNVGLGELSLDTPDAFVDTAVGLAEDAEAIRFLRRHLRPMIQESALCRVEAFTRDLEAALAGAVNNAS